MEERLGRRMPPSYREFLKVSDGWRHAGGFVWLLAGTEDAHWHNNESALAGMFEEYLDEDGEWAVYTWSSWRAAPPERHANFLEFMRDMDREFHSLRAHRSDGEPVFAHDTTRKLDALVEEARLEALRGGWERAGKALDEAKEYGRPRAGAERPDTPPARTDLHGVLRRPGDGPAVRARAAATAGRRSGVLPPGKAPFAAWGRPP